MAYAAVSHYSTTKWNVNLARMICPAQGETVNLCPVRLGATRDLCRASSHILRILCLQYSRMDKYVRRFTSEPRLTISDSGPAIHPHALPVSHCLKLLRALQQYTIRSWFVYFFPCFLVRP